MLKMLKRSAKGADVPHEKVTQNMETVKMPVPKKLVLPMSQHIGAPAAPVVKKGDTVMVGTLIGQAGGFVSANIYSPASGTVSAIGSIRMGNGSMATTVEIETDGLQTVDPAVQPPVVTDRKSFIAAVQACGLVGLGGAGFPAHVKLSPATPVDTLCINGAECEPFLTPDAREFMECSDTIISGIEAVMKWCEIPNCVIGIEANKPECIERMSNLTKDMPGVTVKALPSRYPQGAEKNLIESCTGREVPKTGPEGKPGLPADAGAIVMNVTSISTLGKFLKTGMPLITKRLTVDGDACAHPQNVEVCIGTSFRDVIEFVGGVKEGTELGKLVCGGPMMGAAQSDLDFPILKQNNGMLMFSKQAAAIPTPEPCIRCGRCIDGCPMGLEPVNIAGAFTAKNTDELAKLNIDLCVACGSCSYVCPAKRPVTQTMGLAKAYYLNYLRTQGGK